MALRSRDSKNLLLSGWPGEVERDILALDFAEYYSAALLGLGYDLGLATMSRSSTSNTKVAPGLIVGGAPLSP